MCRPVCSFWGLRVKGVAVSLCLQTDFLPNHLPESQWLCRHKTTKFNHNGQPGRREGKGTDGVHKAQRQREGRGTAAVIVDRFGNGRSRGGGHGVSRQRGREHGGWLIVVIVVIELMWSDFGCRKCVRVSRTVGHSFGLVLPSFSFCWILSVNWLYSIQLLYNFIFILLPSLVNILTVIYLASSLVFSQIY